MKLLITGPKVVGLSERYKYNSSQPKDFQLLVIEGTTNKARMSSNDVSYITSVAKTLHRERYPVALYTDNDVRVPIAQHNNRSVEKEILLRAFTKLTVNYSGKDEMTLHQQRLAELGLTKKHGSFDPHPTQLTIIFNSTDTNYMERVLSCLPNREVQVTTLW